MGRCEDTGEVGKCTEAACSPPDDDDFDDDDDDDFDDDDDDNDDDARHLGGFVPELEERMDVVVDGENHPEPVAFHQLGQC